MILSSSILAISSFLISTFLTYKLINFSKEEMLPSSLAEYISQQKNILQKEDSLRYDLIEEIELELLDLEN